MLRPAFAPLLDSTQRERIIQVVTRFVDTLDSPTSSIDATHTPRLYAKFLRGAIKDVIGAISSVDDEKGSNPTEAAVAKATAQRQQIQTSVCASSAPTNSSAPLSSPPVAESSPEPPTLSYSHSQTPGSLSDECRTPNSIANRSAIRAEPDTGMTIDPYLTISRPSREQEKSGSGNSGASTPLASSTPTPSNSRFSSASGMNTVLDATGGGGAFDTQSGWTTRSQSQGFVQQENSFMGYLNQAHIPSRHLEQHQSWPQNGIRSTSADDLGVGLGAAVMAHGAEVTPTNGVSRAYSYNEYMQSQPQDQSHVGTYPQSPYQSQGAYDTGLLSWANQQFVPYGALQQSISSQILSPPVLTYNAMDLSEDEILATMRAVSSDNWNSSVIMPGYGWGPDEDVGMADN